MGLSLKREALAAHMLRRRVLSVAAVGLVVLLSCSSFSLAAAKSRSLHFGPQPFVPGNSIGPVHLGEPEGQVHLGPGESHQPGSFSYREYSLVVVYRGGRVIVISTAETPGSDLTGALVTPGQYKTHTKPVVAIGTPMAQVSSAYPQAECKHYTLNAPGGIPDLVTEDCVLQDPRDHSGTFFGGAASNPKRGPILIGAIFVTIASAVPHLPSCASKPVPLC